MINGLTVSVVAADTGGSEQCDGLRNVSYEGADIFLFGFSVDSPQSLHTIINKYTSETQNYAANAPRMLIGLKTDLRRSSTRLLQNISQQEAPITKELAKSVAKKLNCVAYIECSAKNHENIEQMFSLIIRTAYFSEYYREMLKQHPDKKCNIQ